MGINTVSFDKARIYKNKMYFTQYNTDKIYTKVFDNNGNNILNRISSKAVKTLQDDCVIISHENKYEYPDKVMIFETLRRIYDKTGKFIKSDKIITRL